MRSESCSFLLVLLEPGQLVVMPRGAPGPVGAEQFGQAASLLCPERVDQPEGDLEEGKPSEDPAGILGSQGIHHALQDNIDIVIVIVIMCNILMISPYRLMARK